MGKILKPLAVIAAIAVNVIPGVGQAISAAAFSAIGTGTFAALGAAAAIGSIATAAITIGGLAALGSLTRPKIGSAGLAAIDPASLNADKNAPRKIVVGRAPFFMDLRYAEPSGSNQEYIDYIFCLAAHRSESVDEIYIDDDIAWTVGGGVQGKYVGYLTIEVILNAGAGAYHTVNGGTNWGAAQRLTGCTTMKVRVKRSDNSKTSQSPFGNGISGRWTVIGKGMPVYDPARDSTVAGGSGSQRANDCTTWAWSVSSVERGANPALQLLSILLGWKINGIGSVGYDYDPDTLNLPGWATAAARCDEAVALVAGGSQRRYETGGGFTDLDDMVALIGAYEAAVNGEFTDHGGQFNFRVAVNDLTPAVTLTDDDFVAGYDWQPQPPPAEQFTVVRGQYSQPDAPSLYQLSDVAEVAIPRTSRAPKPLPIDLRLVQEPRRAQRIFKQVAQRQLIRGEFRVTLGIRGWLMRRTMVVAVNSNVRGWTDKLFRVLELGFNLDGTVTVVLREESALIYAWDLEESAVVTPPGPVVFDSRKAASWLMADIAPGADVTLTELPTAPAGTWAAGNNYVTGAIVPDGNSLWVALQDHTSASGNRPGADPDYWRLFNPAPDTANLGTSASVSFSTGSMAGTSYGSPVGSLSVKAGAGGIVDLSAAGEAALELGSGASGTMKVQRETSPGTWADVGSEATSVSVTDTTPGVTNFAPFNRAWQATGLTNGTSYNFRILGRRTAGASGSEISIGGLFTGNGR